LKLLGFLLYSEVMKNTEAAQMEAIPRSPWFQPWDRSLADSWKGRPKKHSLKFLLLPPQLLIMKTINDFSFSGKKVLIRVDFNVPLDAAFNVTDDTRIVAAVPTIQKIIKDGGSVILMSHLGRPKGGNDEKYSLKHIIQNLSKALALPVKFSNDCIGPEAEKMAAELQTGEVLLLENLRFHVEEEKGDTLFSQQLAALGDFYVNDAFGTAHRRHASTAVIAEFFKNKKALGLLMAAEVHNISKVLHHAERPYTAIIGGAKVSTKLNIIKNLVDNVDNFIIGGGMVFTFIKALGGNVGKSLVEDEMVDNAKEIIALCKKHGVNLYLPKDSVCSTEFSEQGVINTFETMNIPDGYMGLDIGELAIKEYSKVISDSKTIMWNGPMGVFEMMAFQKGTQQIGIAIANATDAGAFSLVGGGDSVAAVNKFNLSESISYVSTGGGAMLELMEGIKLPGIAAIEE
jgi:phosphoglycerate kinase